MLTLSKTASFSGQLEFPWQPSLQGGALEVDLMKEEALLAVIEPVRDACAVCTSRLNTSYLQDLTLFSWPLRRDVHFCVHRHYSERRLTCNSHGPKMEKQPKQTEMCTLLLSQPLHVLTRAA